MKSTEEYVVLVDNKNNQLGVELKSRVHTANTPMHRAFSLFIFNPKGQLLLQQRAHSKQTWPGVWSNSVCGHPLPKESFIAAARRRACYELGLNIPANELLTILPGYTYRYEHKGVVEHEFCPVLVAKSTEEVAPNPAEVANTRWIDWADFVAETKQTNDYSEWCVEETQLLNTNSEFQQFYKGLGQ